jgi:hypothetical protein
MDKESEASAEVVLPLHNRITCELTTRESILTKTSETFEIAKKGGEEGDEHAQTVRGAPNTISVEIKVLPALSMPMPQLPMENGELSQGTRETFSNMENYGIDYFHCLKENLGKNLQVEVK